MATIEEIKEILKAEVSRVNVDEIPADGLLSDYDIDSLDRSSVFMAIEDKYSISIPDNDLEKLGTINSIIDYINEKVAKLL